MIKLIMRNGGESIWYEKVSVVGLGEVEMRERRGVGRGVEEE